MTDMEFEEITREDLMRTIEEIKERLGDMSAEERAYTIAKYYMELCDKKYEQEEEIPDELFKSFTGWLASPLNADAKDRAIERLMEEEMEIAMS